MDSVSYSFVTFLLLPASAANKRTMAHGGKCLEREYKGLWDNNAPESGGRMLVNPPDLGKFSL